MLMPSEFKAEVLAYIEAAGGSFTVADIMAACDLDLNRAGMDATRWKLHRLLKALEADGVIVSWVEPGAGVGTKHWRLP